VEAHGTDLSVPAIELAAKGYPEATFVVANADRFLPYAAGSFDLALSLTARRHGPELRRVLSERGLLLVAVPGADDLVELRSAVLGATVLRDRGETTAEALAAEFTLVDRQTVRWSADLDAGAVRDALAATYRGARERERERSAALGGLTVTLSRELLVFRAGTGRSPASPQPGEGALDVAAAVGVRAADRARELAVDPVAGDVGGPLGGPRAAEEGEGHFAAVGPGQGEGDVGLKARAGGEDRAAGLLEHQGRPPGAETGVVGHFLPTSVEGGADDDLRGRMVAIAGEAQDRDEEQEEQEEGRRDKSSWE
jgi:23S rRNA (guanine745-N1)-methyltransferase